MSLIEIAAERAPVACGVNVTLIVQLPFTAIDAGLTGQLLVWPKSAIFAPVTEMPVIISALGPLLVKVIGCAVLAVFTN